MPVYVLIVESGKTVSVDVSEECTVPDLKTAVADKVGIPADKALLYFCRKELYDSRTVADYGIRKNDSLCLLIRGRDPKPNAETIDHLPLPVDDIGEWCFNEYGERVYYRFRTREGCESYLGREGCTPDKIGL